jgi:hypothetical protein
MDETTRILTIKSLDDFQTELRKRWDGHYLYRGEDSNAYTLRPKYGRYQASDARNDLARERALLAAFKRRASPFLEQPPENEWEWLGVAQHFGLATRLVDWTENPLIASFFATAEPTDGGDRVVRLLDTTKVTDADENTDPFGAKTIAIYRPRHLSRRVTSQGSIFTAHPSPSTPFDGGELEKWTISAECLVDFRLTLASFGIDRAFVFPGLDSVAADLNHQWVWGIRS